MAKRVGEKPEHIAHVYGTLAELVKQWGPVDPAKLVREARNGRPMPAIRVT